MVDELSSPQLLMCTSYTNPPYRMLRCKDLILKIDIYTINTWYDQICGFKAVHPMQSRLLSLPAKLIFQEMRVADKTENSALERSRVPETCRDCLKVCLVKVRLNFLRIQDIRRIIKSMKVAELES